MVGGKERGKCYRDVIYGVHNPIGEITGGSGWEDRERVGRGRRIHAHRQNHIRMSHATNRTQARKTLQDTHSFRAVESGTLTQALDFRRACDYVGGCSDDEICSLRRPVNQDACDKGKEEEPKKEGGGGQEHTRSKAWGIQKPKK
jgi:hypothetical protein